MRANSTTTPRATLASTLPLLIAATAPAQTILPGSDIQIPSPPPDSICRGAAESSQHILLIAERQAVLLSDDLLVDIDSPGTHTNGAPPTGAREIPAGTLVDCWILHQDSPGSGQLRLEGSMLFPGQVLGMLVKRASIQSTDETFRRPGMQYPSDCGGSNPHRKRGLEFDEGAHSDRITLHADLRQVDIEFDTRDWVDEVRVITVASVAPVASFCDGEADCPCDNDILPGASGGCRNSTQQGARLTHGGSVNVALSDFSLTIESLPAGTHGIVFMGTSAHPAAPFGDGLLCVHPGPPGNPYGHGFFRFPVRTASPGGTILEPDVIGYSSANFLPDGIITPGSTWYFQGYYRDPWMTSCTSAYFNLSNALEVQFE